MPDEFDGVSEGKGKLSPTSSHLFALILPLPKAQPPIVLLLHPSQPLSHVGRLILASFPHFRGDTSLSLSFRSTSPSGRDFQYSDSTDVGDFIRDAARATKFSICICSDKSSEDTVIDVEVPTFADRTRYLRRRLDLVNTRLKDMEGLKKECDYEARRGARRVALGGFGILVVYWGAVARLTFWDFGWDVMEPITYLSGLSTVICGYLWFLYQGREVSYSSILDRSISARREALYKARGLDIDRWLDLVGEAKSLRKEIRRIAEDYDEGSKGEEEDEDEGKGKGKGKGKGLDEHDEERKSSRR